jgi:hypothetical protein
VNIFSGSDYCGRRFSSSEELLVHLKTHTNISSSDPRAALLPAVTSGSTSPTPSSTGRFHPYARPFGGSMPSSLTSLGLGQGYPLSYASLYPSLFPRPPLLWSQLPFRPQCIAISKSKWTPRLLSCNPLWGKQHWKQIKSSPTFRLVKTNKTC